MLLTNTEVNILLLVVGAAQAALLFFLLYKKRRSLPGYIFLALYMSVMLLQVTLKLADKVWIMKHLEPLYQFSYQLPFLYGPLLYLFILKFTGYRQPRLRDIYHFITSIIVISILVIMPPYLLLRVIRIIFFDQAVTACLQLASIVVYHLCAFTILKKRSNQRALPKWIRQFVKKSLVVCSAVAMAIFFLDLFLGQWSYARFVFLALTIFIYWAIYKAWRHRGIFSVTRGNANSANAPTPLLTAI